MKKLNYFLFIIIISSCSINKNIKHFESTLGKENSETLTYLVKDFEDDFLLREYPDLKTKKAYKKFLEDIKNDNIKYWDKKSKTTIDRFNKSKLRQEMYCTSDSIWNATDAKGDSLIKIRIKCLQEDGSYGYGISESYSRRHWDLSIESINKMREEWLDVNQFGKYSKALISISNKSFFLNEHISKRNFFGEIAPFFVAKNMLEAKVDFDDYFIKRLIITEIVY